MNITKIGSTINNIANNTVKTRSIKKYGPSAPIKIPNDIDLNITGMDRYGNEMLSTKDWNIIRHNNGSKVYFQDNMKVVTNETGDIIFIKNRDNKIIYSKNGNQIDITYSPVTNRMTNATIYTKKYPKGIEINSLTESPKTGKLCYTCANKKSKYYGITPDGKIRYFNRKKKTVDNEFLELAAKSPSKFEFASIPVELLRAAYLGKI